MGIGNLMGNLFHSAAREAAEKAAADTAAKVAAQNATHDAAVDVLRNQLHVTSDSSLPAIYDSFKRSNELVYANGASYVYGNRVDAAKALLDKEIYQNPRWEVFPEETYTQVHTAYTAAKAQTLFRTEALASGEVDTNAVSSVIAPMSPQKVTEALGSKKGVVIHDRVAHKRLPASNLDELFQAAKSFLGKQ